MYLPNATDIMQGQIVTQLGVQRVQSCGALSMELGVALCCPTCDAKF